MEGEDKSSPAGAFTKFEDLTKIPENDWNVHVYRTCYGGGSGQEFPENLKKDGDSNGNKWYDPNSGETWIEAEFYMPTRVKFIQLRSANDCPERDPYKITFSVKVDDNSDYKDIGTYDNIMWENRYQNLDFNIDTCEAIKRIRVTINKNRYSAFEENHWGSGTQLAQFILYK